jgi:hypothetical protein
MDDPGISGPERKGGMTVWIALLRAVNVSGVNRLAMAA